VPYRLVAIKGPLKGRTFVVVKTETKIGRDPANDLVLSDEYVSRLHATIVTRGRKHMVVNASPNGTLVNGKRVERATLKPGDEITFGASTVLRYEPEATATRVRTPTAAAVEKEAETPVPAAVAPRVSLWRRRPKILLAGLAYLAVLGALGVFLATRRSAKKPAKVAFLTREQIDEDLLHELTRDRDRREAKRAVDRAMDLYERRYVNPANLYAAIVAFKEAEAYLGSSLSKPEHITAFDAASRELGRKVEDLYFEAYALQKSGRYDDARDRYARILQYVNDPKSVIYRNASKRIEALQPFLEKKRWGGR